MSISISKNPTGTVTFFWLFLSVSVCFSFLELQAQTPNAWINEIHYNNIGNDTGEGVEVVIEDAAFFDLSSFTITFYNGSNGKVYKGIGLKENMKGAVVLPFTIYTAFVAGIQNDLEGIALSYQGELLQFLSYGGAFTATDGIAQGITSTDIGVRENDQTPEGFSLQLVGEGNRYNTFEWHVPLANTFDQVNTGQILRLIDGPPPVTDLQQVNVAPDKVQISWAKPIGVHKEDWDGVLLFASRGPNEVALINKDFTDFQGGNHIFGKGTKTGNSFTVARKETNEHGEVIITGLERGVNYYFTAYTYKNIEGTNNDLFSDPSNMIVTKPEVSDISALSATPLFEKARLNWSNSMGNKVWWKTILILASKSPITYVPDQRNYAANAIYGQGEAIEGDVYTVYNGQDAQAVIYGLDNNTTYHFKIFVQYLDAQNHFYWSSGKSISCAPAENIKLWTGNAATNQFEDDNNWEPNGSPGATHDVVLDHQYITTDYEVLFPSGHASIQFNSLQILPDADKTITVKLTATTTSEAALTLLDEEEPLIIGDYGIFVNGAGGQATLAIPNGPITLEPKGTYIHNSTSSHKAIIENISIEEGTIPGTIIFDIPSNQNHILSLSGKTFQNLTLSSSTHTPSYSASGNNSIIIKEALVIDNTTLNLSALKGELNINGSLVLDGNLTSSSAIVFDGEGEQFISSADTLITLDNLKVNKLSGNLTLNNDLQIQTSLILEKGNLITEENQVILDYSVDAPVISISPPAQLIGNLVAIRHVGKGKVDFEEAGVVIEAGEDDLGLVRVIRKTGPDAAVENGNSKSIYRNWEVFSEGALNENRLLTFSWEEGEDEEVDLMRIKVWKKDAALEKWIPLGDFKNGLQRTITVAIDEFTQFTVADEHNVLPLTFLSFTAESQSGYALLQWTTWAESNNAGFQIEKSLDSRNFYTIGFEEGKGNGLAGYSYQFIDSSFYKSAYFRLKQTDFDGKITYAPIRYLAFPAHPSTSVKVYPNPIVDRINLSISPKSPIEFCAFYCEGGEIVYQSKSLSLERLENELNTKIPDLPSGLYILHLGVKGSVQKIKLLKESK